MICEFDWFGGFWVWYNMPFRDLRVVMGYNVCVYSGVVISCGVCCWLPG